MDRRVINKKYLNENDISNIEGRMKNTKNKNSEEIFLEMISFINNIKQYCFYDSDNKNLCYNFNSKIIYGVIESYFDLIRYLYYANDIIDIKVFYDNLFTNENYYICKYCYNEFFYLNQRNNYKNFREIISTNNKIDKKILLEITKINYLDTLDIFFINKFINDYIFENQYLNKKFFKIVIEYLAKSFHLFFNYLFHSYEFEDEMIKLILENYFDSIFIEIRNKELLNKNEILLIKLFIKEILNSEWEYYNNIKEKIKSNVFNYFSNENFLKDKKSEKIILKELMKI